MIAQDSYNYLHIGLCLRLLSNLSTSTTKSFAKREIELLTNKLQAGGFVVSLSAMKSDTYREMISDLKGQDTTSISQETVNKITECFDVLEEIVFAEALTKQIYVLPNRRFNSEYLLSAPSKLLKAGSFEKLDEIAKSEFTSSCRCILFGEATAAAFHILRATESVLKSYYLHHRKQKRLNKPMWGPMLDQLKAKKKNGPPAPLLSSLDTIRTAYRNPTQHPEATYEIDGAQDLLGVCIDVIGKMTEELP